MHRHFGNVCFCYDVLLKCQPEKNGQVKFIIIEELWHFAPICPIAIRTLSFSAGPGKVRFLASRFFTYIEVLNLLRGSVSSYETYRPEFISACGQYRKYCQIYSVMR